MPKRSDIGVGLYGVSILYLMYLEYAEAASFISYGSQAHSLEQKFPRIFQSYGLGKLGRQGTIYQLKKNYSGDLVHFNRES